MRHAAFSLFLFSLIILGFTLANPGYAADATEPSQDMLSTTNPIPGPAPTPDTAPEEPPVVVAPVEAPAPGDPAKARSLYQKIPDSYIEAAEAFHNQCLDQDVYYLYHDCDCMAVKYLDKKLEFAPGQPESSILASISTECMDGKNVPGVVYNECMGNALQLPVELDIGEYCKCYAKTFTKMFLNVKPLPNSEMFLKLKTEAAVTCQDPELGARLYPYRQGQ